MMTGGHVFCSDSALTGSTNSFGNGTNQNMNVVARIKASADLSFSITA